MRAETLLGVLALLSLPVLSLSAQAEPLELPPEVQEAGPDWAWGPGTLIQNQYRELAGTLLVEAGSFPVVRSEGRDYRLMLKAKLPEPTLLKNKTPVIFKGIATVLSLPGRPTQYGFWPIVCTVKLHKIEFPDPTPGHWRWLVALGSQERAEGP